MPSGDSHYNVYMTGGYVAVGDNAMIKVAPVPPGQGIQSDCLGVYFLKVIILFRFEFSLLYACTHETQP